MKNVVLGRKRDACDKWIYIATEMTDDGFVANGTKLLVDDGKYSDSTQLDLLQERLQNLSGYNNTDSWDKSLSMIDWFTTLGLSFYGAKNNKYLPC